MHHQKRSKPEGHIYNKSRDPEKNKGSKIIIDLNDIQRNYESAITLALRGLSKATRSKMPMDLQPMLATLTDEAFNDKDWQFELKLDGYRALAYVRKGKADLRSRNNNNFNGKFAPIQQELSRWPLRAIIDGEIVVLNEKGVADFHHIQQWDLQQKGQLVYYAFDLLWIEGWNIMEEPLHMRRTILKELLPESGIIRFSDHIDNIGKDFFKLARKNQLEGIVAKHKHAPYIPGARSKTWLKIKVEQRHEAIICGYEKKKNTTREFSSLLLGIYKDGQLHYIGQTGTGFSAKMQHELLGIMNKHHTQICPFNNEPVIHSSVTWLEPALVCEVKYTELTPDGLMRHASFQGLRMDKAVKDLNVE